MKHPTGSVKPRRRATLKAVATVPTRKVRLDLKRRPEPEPEPELGLERKNQFWKWVSLVALLHVLVIGAVCFVYRMLPSPQPPEQFISLLPEGDVVKGTPGAQEAHKVGPTTTASTQHHHESKPPPVASAQPKPVIPKPLAPPPAIEPPNPNSLALDKPAPKPPAKPKVKVDLTLADAPTPAVDKPKIKHHKKPVVKPTEDTADDSQDDSSSPDSAGLSKEQIAEKLGDKLDAAGVKDAPNTGTSGAENAHPNSFADFYASIRDQVMSQWESPNLTDETAVNPVVEIHVEKDGEVPPGSVHLIQSSGNQTYDDSALEAARNLGYLHEPLPDGCPPDIPITFKLTR